MSLQESAAAAAAAAAQEHRLLLVDGQRIFRESLRAVLAAQDGLAVVGEAAQRRDVLELVGALQPDLVITELHLADGSAVELFEQMRVQFPKVAVLVLTAARARDAALAARKAGALGYLLKDCGRGELHDAVRTVLAGRSYRSRAPESARARRDSGGASTRAVYLTERQRLVLRSVARGQPARQIAAMLGISVRAVHRQRERLRNTLQLDSTAALARFALREGFAE